MCLVRGPPFLRQGFHTSTNPDSDRKVIHSILAPSVNIPALVIRQPAILVFIGVPIKGRAGQRNSSSSAPTPNLGGTSQLGIHGLLRTVETSATVAQNNLEDSIQDLEALMVKAKDMVRLAEDLNERLTAINTAASTTSNATPLSTAANPAAVEPEEATFIRSSLSQLGLQMTNAPVTLDMIRDERKWVEELARELADVLQSGKGSTGRTQGAWAAKLETEGGIMGKRGIVGLDEIWGGWNRARGIALIPPSTFLQVLPVLATHTSPPIHMRTFSSSGLSVLHTPPYSKAAFAARMVGLLTLESSRSFISVSRYIPHHLTFSPMPAPVLTAAGPKTTVEVAHEESLPMGLVQDMVVEVEEAGEICRDEGGGGVDVFSSGRDGGGSELCKPHGQPTASSRIANARKHVDDRAQPNANASVQSSRLCSTDPPPIQGSNPIDPLEIPSSLTLTYVSDRARPLAAGGWRE
ncbi:hypothetical protein EIP91_010505 [Steccherinum ochraceum]|uniref:Vacuolar protein-sorting-associated protein 36 n=1 Tax=Steccherinum ochraceum TaxID=92696 RepID=A0A4R0R353_9APHY|nr:hypothetical protein EIP91_010505 [Steccherinum ochraceum]